MATQPDSADRIDPADAARYRAYWQDELDSAALYWTLAEAEADPRLAEVYRRLSATEAEHARHWEARLREAGQPVPAARPSGRARALG
jgi:vacuolar iron transporter family protein